jgi:tetratricopeptide (TPR) repeat protein
VTGSISAAPAEIPAPAQTPAPSQKEGSKLPPVAKQAPSVKAEAYYHFSMGHLYQEMAGAYGNRSDYVNKAIDNYRLAIKEDPSASFLIEEIAELYRVSGRIREAVEEAQSALKANPDDLNARRVLARIYTQQIGDTQANKVDEGMVRRAIEQYKVITQKDSKDVDSLVMMGRLDRVIGDSVSAEAAFRQATTLEPDNEDAIVGLASVYSDRNDTKSSSALLEKLAQKNPSPRALMMLANNYESMHEYSLAADAYKKAIDLDPNRVEIKEAMAQDLALGGRYDEALDTYKSLSEGNAQDPQPYVRMAQIYREQKKYTEARQSIDKAKAIDPDNAEVRYFDAGLLQLEGKTAEAITVLKNLLDSTAHKTYDQQQTATRAEMLNQLGSAYRTDNQYEQAVDTFRQISILSPDLAPSAEAEVIETYRVAKDYKKAQEESDAVAKKYPNNRVLTQIRAELDADLGKTDAAAAELKKLLDGKAGDREVYLQLAETYQKAKNYGEMAKMVDAADKLSSDKAQKTGVLFVRGEMFERQKKFDQAEKIFRQVLDDDPSNASALNYLGYMLADQNVRLQEAQDLIRKAVSIEPNNYAYLDSLGWVLYRLNRLNDAEQQLTHSVHLMSKDPTIHDHLGDVYFKQGKVKEAIQEWQSSLKEWNTGAPSEVEPDEVAKIQKKLDSARVRLAKSQVPVQQ